MLKGSQLNQEYLVKSGEVGLADNFSAPMVVMYTYLTGFYTIMNYAFPNRFITPDCQALCSRSEVLYKPNHAKLLDQIIPLILEMHHPTLLKAHAIKLEIYL